MALFKLPRILERTAIVDNGGKAIRSFTRYWDEFAKAIEAQVASIINTVEALAAIVAQIQAVTILAQNAADAANTAQETADAAGGGTVVSGSASATVTVLGDSTWVNGPQVDLTAVVAGTLTITGSGPQQTSDVAMSGISGTGFANWRVVEIVGVTETVVFSGGFRGNKATDFGSTTITNTSAAAVAAFSDPAASTGAVSYRLDLFSSDRDFTDLTAYLYARRA